MKELLYLEDEKSSPRLVEVNCSPWTVIVAERHPIARAALAALLSYDGYRVFQAENLDAAISKINGVHEADVLLADLEMPGWRTIVHQAVRASDALVIGMEGSHPISAMYDLSDRGIRLCLQKPIIYKTLRTAIEANMRVRHALDFSRNETAPDCNKRPAQGATHRENPIQSQILGSDKHIRQ